ncbi:transcriptional regulator [Arthrobacter sp. zg-Y877]|uniref:transcriptional regulator n=1 Tax=Arthrobacter sp. zg-Y877 TaxID=3049074 RepID=UPI0025A3D819|nr:transcriptional regulator [Arthrobacter sp. zg-Y877]MDM7989121.1 transcriptional regulator [Arthrobacter sp. zg-Y877]
MPKPKFDEVVHPPTRLRICGLLRPVEQMDFAVLRDTLGISDATLSKQLKVLGDAGYVRLAKTTSPARRDARRITWVALTPAGRSSFDAHVLALQEIAGLTARRPE